MSANLISVFISAIIVMAIVISVCFFLITYIRLNKEENKQVALGYTRHFFFVSLVILIFLYILDFYSDALSSINIISYISFRTIYYSAIVSSTSCFILLYFERYRFISLDNQSQDLFSVQSTVKHAWLYPGILAAILTGGALIQLSIIGDYYFWTDEAYSFHAAKMILEKGEPLYDSGLYYGRASIYHYLMAQSMHIFGTNEFGSRIINITANMISTVIIYLSLKGISRTAGLFAAFLFMFSSFTIAMTIETRFYAFFTMAFLGMAYTFYKTFVEGFNGQEKAKLFYVDYFKTVLGRCSWLLLFLVFFYLSYNTHNFYSLFVFGLVCYFGLSLFLDKNWQINLLFFLSCIGAIFAGAYHLTGSFNLYYAYFEETTLGWAADTARNPGFYLSRIHNNFPLYFLLITPALAVLLTGLSKLQRYYYSLLIGGFFILLPQRAVAERYMASMVPFIYIIITLSLVYLFIYFRKQKLGKCLVILMVVIYSIFHLQIFAEEVLYPTYEGRLSAQKKLHFPRAMELLDEKLNDEVILIADFHAAYTLYVYDYEPDYLIISRESEYNLSRGILENGVLHEPYFKIPFLIAETFVESTLPDTERIIILARRNLGDLEGFETVYEESPFVYINY